MCLSLSLPLLVQLDLEVCLCLILFNLLWSLIVLVYWHILLELYLHLDDLIPNKNESYFLMPWCALRSSLEYIWHLFAWHQCQFNKVEWLKDVGLLCPLDIPNNKCKTIYPWILLLAFLAPKKAMMPVGYLLIDKLKWPEPRVIWNR